MSHGTTKQTAHIDDWQAFDAAIDGSAEFQSMMKHIDGCKTCQSRLEQHVADFGTPDSSSTDTAEDSCITAAEIVDSLRDFSEQDWTPVQLELTVEYDSGESAEADSFEGELHFTDHQDLIDPPPHPELLGCIGRYHIDRFIGRGGMGVVYRAYDSELHRIVAVKVLAKHLNSSGAARQRFVREARASAAVLHPNVLRIHDISATGRSPYIVTNYVSGESLQARVDRDGPLPVATALRIAKQCAAALAAAHEQGLIHRDVKPANILLEDGTDTAVLGDFGLARTSDDASLTRTGVVAGTPCYMSPEQAHGADIGTRSDLFAVGCVLYFMLTGRPPFRADSAMSTLHRVCTVAHEPLTQVNADVPREVSQLVDALLHKKAAQRPNAASVVVDRIDDLLTRLQAGRLRLSKPRVSTRAKIGRATAGLGAVVVLALAAWNILDSNVAPGPQEIPQEIFTGETALTAPMATENSPPLPFEAVTNTQWLRDIQQLDADLRQLEIEFSTAPAPLFQSPSTNGGASQIQGAEFAPSAE